MGFLDEGVSRGCSLVETKSQQLLINNLEVGRYWGTVVPLGTLWLGQDFVTNFSAAEKLIWGKHLKMVC